MTRTRTLPNLRPRLDSACAGPSRRSPIGSYTHARWRTRQARPHAKLLELVHRLDRDTSGIMLVAKKRSPLTDLQDQIREREASRTYLPLAQRECPARNKRIDLPTHK